MSEWTRTFKNIPVCNKNCRLAGQKYLNSVQLRQLLFQRNTINLFNRIFFFADDSVLYENFQDIHEISGVLQFPTSNITYILVIRYILYLPLLIKNTFLSILCRLTQDIVYISINGIDILCEFNIGCSV